MSLTETLNQGIAAAQANNKQEARRLLKEVVAADETQVVAWLWLYKVVDSLEEKAICLENVLMLEPDNEYAQERLARVKTQQESLFTSPYAAGEEEPPPSVITEPPDIPITAEYPHKDEFDNELLCPYCLALTERQDRRCPSCHHSLIISKRVRDERTVWLWRGFFLQLGVSFFIFAFGAGYMTLIGKLNGITTPVPYLPLYFGQSIGQPGRLVETMLSIFPLWLFWGIIAASLYSFILVILLYARVPYGNVLYLITATATAMMGLVMLIFYNNTWAGFGVAIVAIVLGLTQLAITFNLWNDFTFKERRLILRLDRGVKNAHSMMISGRKYSQLGMWGLAVIHLRGAVGRKPENSTYHLALITAYIKVKRYDLAQQSLDYAAQLSFDSPEFSRLQQQVTSLRQRT